MPRDPLEPKVLPKISVVICTFNRHDVLLEAIMSIELQDLPAQEYELIIVDNSDDLQARDQFRDGLQITCGHRYLDEARPRSIARPQYWYPRRARRPRSVFG